MRLCSNRFSLVVITVLCCCAATVFAQGTKTVDVFNMEAVHFNKDNPSQFASKGITVLDNGRQVLRHVTLPSYNVPVTITAHLEVHPLPKDELDVCDKWDRAGDIALVKPGMADIQLVKFITSYGGYTEYNVDVSELASLLQGECDIRGTIDTWVSPAWKISFSLSFEPDSEAVNPGWAAGIMYEKNFTSETEASGGVVVNVDVPSDLDRVELYYFVSGHCTDGQGADEFEQKDNVIYVDDDPVYRFRPWRDDCRDFRDVNPYTRRWSDGWWSSDYSRSGWCPGDYVAPLVLDLTDHLTPGKHRVRFNVEHVRPKDDKGNHGYWRMSSYLVGTKL